MNATYLVAKYMPDILRREPSNIGIMLYDEGKWFTRFVGEDPSTGDLDGRRFRHQFSSQETYLEWYHFWTKAIVRGLEDQNGTVVCPDDNSFVDVLCDASSPQFIVEMGAPTMLPTTVGDGDSLLAYLFTMLVSEEMQTTQETHEERTLKQKMRKVISNYGLSSNQHFRQPYKVEVPVEDVMQELIFPYAYVNGTRRLYRNMAIKHTTWEAEELQMAVSHVLWSFEKIGELKGGDHRIVLMQTDGDDEMGTIGERARELVSVVAEQVVDVDSADDVEAEFGPLAVA